MPRAIVNLQDPADLRAVQGQWRFAPGFIPGQPNEGLIAQAEGSSARLPDYDDSAWEVCHDITPGRSHGFTFAWYRIKVTLPETVQGQDIRSGRLLFETCVDDYGEIWINGVCDRERGAGAQHYGANARYSPSLGLVGRPDCAAQMAQNPRPWRR